MELRTDIGSGVRSAAMVWAVIALIGLLAMGHLWWLPAHAALNVNEGWNAGQAMRALGAGPLYPHPEALTANNYPPLSFYIVGAAGWLTGDMIVAGRVIALLAQIANGLAVYIIVRRLADARWGMIGVLLFAGYSVTLLRAYLAINDPQWLGQVAMSWALVLLLPPRAGGRIAIGTVGAAALLVVAGGLIKHNLVAFPIAIMLWLWWADRRALMVWIASGLLFAGIAALGLLAIWGTTVFVDVLSPARSYSFARMAAKGGPLLALMLPALLASHALIARLRGDVRMALPLLLLVVSIPLGIVQRSGSGVDVNAFFEGILALSIAVPVACALRRDAPYRWLAIAALPALCLLPVSAIRTIGDLSGRDEAVRSGRAFIAAIAAIAAAPGPVACDDQAICYWAGRESGIDFFSVKQRLLKGDGDALVPALDRSHFAMIQMRSDNPGWQKNLLIPIIRAHYRTVSSSGGSELLVPKS